MQEISGTREAGFSNDQHSCGASPSLQTRVAGGVAGVRRHRERIVRTK